MIDSSLRRRAFALARPMKSYFRYELDGLDNVPSEGPTLIVSPHSLISIEAMFLMDAIDREYGRVCRPLGDHALFDTPIIGDLLTRFGVVDGKPEKAIELLSQGEICLVMPGGAHEAWKPSRDKYKLYWDRSQGFIRVALRAQAAIVPTACVGPDESIYMPFHSLDWGRKVWQRRLPLTLGVGALGLVPLPFPVKFRAFVGAPIRFNLPPEAADDPTIVTDCHRQVTHAVMALLQRGLDARRSLWS